MAKYTRFYLTKWKPDGDSTVCRLMEREGSDDGTDAIVAVFTMHPFPLGEQLAEAALAAANTYADEVDAKLSSSRGAIGGPEALCDESAKVCAQVPASAPVVWGDT